jgi:predicted component of type VI protein secretion system
MTGLVLFMTPVKTHYEYLSLARSGAVWHSITPARNLAAYLPAEFPNAEMELIILLPQSRS